MRHLSRSQGYSLLELLVSIAIVGIIGAFVITKYADQRERAFVAAMMNDVRNFVSAAAQHEAEAGPISSYQDVIDGPIAYGFSPDVVPDSFAITDGGYYFRVRHNKSDTRCSIWYSHLVPAAENRVICPGFHGPGLGTGVAGDEPEPVILVFYDNPVVGGGSPASGGSMLFGSAAPSPGAPMSGLHAVSAGMFSLGGSPFEIGQVAALSLGEMPEPESFLNVRGLEDESGLTRNRFKAGVPLRFDGTQSRPSAGATITHFRWDLTGDGTIDAEGPVVLWTYAVAGHRNVQLFVRDSNGREGEGVRDLVVEPDYPDPAVAIAYAPEDPTVATPVALSGIPLELGGPGEAPPSFHWTIGHAPAVLLDGQQIEHQFLVPGFHPVRLNMVSELGQVAQADTTIWVGAEMGFTISFAGDGAGSVRVQYPGYDEVHTESLTLTDIPYAATVSLTASPEAGSSFGGWSGSVQGAGAAQSFVADGDGAAVAAFDLHRYTLGVSTTGSGSGSVRVQGSGIDETISGSGSIQNIGHGTTLQITATPDAGSTWSGWSAPVQGQPQSFTTTLVGSGTVEAIFSDGSEPPPPAPSLRTLTLNVSGSGAGSVRVQGPGGFDEMYTASTSVQIEEGTLTLTASPQSGSTFSGWSGAGTGSGTTRTVELDQDRTVGASFAQITRSLNLNITGTGSGTVTVSYPGFNQSFSTSSSIGGIPDGTTVTLTRSVSAGSVFAGWFGDGSGTSSRTVVMSQNRSVEARFNRGSYSLWLNIGGSGTGNVRVQYPGFDQTFSSNATVSGIPGGTTVSLTPSASGSSSFSGWTSGSAGSGSPNRSVHVTSNSLVEAVFETPTYNLTVSTTGTGSGTVTVSYPGVNPSVVSSHETRTFWGIPAGTTVSVQASPSAGSSFVGWSGSISGTQTSRTITMSGNRSATAEFATATRSLTLGITGQGSGTVHVSYPGYSQAHGAGTTIHGIPDGTSVSLSPSAASGSVFGAWTGSGSGSPTRTVSMTADRSASARFDLLTHTLSLSFSGDGTGSVSVSYPGFSTTLTSAGSVAGIPHGTTVALEAGAGQNSQFDGWSGTTTPASTTAAVLMNASRSVGVAFRAIEAPPLSGCTNPAATNYNPSATEDDDSCDFGTPVADFEQMVCYSHQPDIWSPWDLQANFVANAWHTNLNAGPGDLTYEWSTSPMNEANLSGLPADEYTVYYSNRPHSFTVTLTVYDPWGNYDSMTMAFESGVCFHY